MFQHLARAHLRFDAIPGRIGVLACTIKLRGLAGPAAAGPVNRRGRLFAQLVFPCTNTRFAHLALLAEVVFPNSGDSVATIDGKAFFREMLLLFLTEAQSARSKA
jgi:hypothetical protein